jgi:hypothetical protein
MVRIAETQGYSVDTFSTNDAPPYLAIPYLPLIQHPLFLLIQTRRLQQILGVAQCPGRADWEVFLVTPVVAWVVPQVLMELALLILAVAGLGDWQRVLEQALVEGQGDWQLLLVPTVAHPGDWRLILVRALVLGPQGEQLGLESPRG